MSYCQRGYLWINCNKDVMIRQGKWQSKTGNRTWFVFCLFYSEWTGAFFCLIWSRYVTHCESCNICVKIKIILRQLDFVSITFLLFLIQEIFNILFIYLIVYLIFCIILILFYWVLCSFKSQSYVYSHYYLGNGFGLWITGLFLFRVVF